jgi:tetratricopeptide (TPR) repeat protein
MIRARPRSPATVGAPERHHAQRRGLGGATRLVALVLLSSLAVACSRHAGPVPPAGEGARAQLLIDAGNQAFRAGNFGLAARRYAAAAVIKKDDPAAYYGLGMALAKLERDEEARAAYARARELAKP